MPTKVKDVIEEKVVEEVDEFAIDPELQKLIEMLDGKVASAGGGKRSNIVFLPEGSHIIKMVIPQDRELQTYFEPYTNWYNGSQTTNYLINAVIVKSTKEGLEDRTKVRHIRLPATAIRQVNAQIINPIFADDGPVLTVKLYKEGGNTKYMVTPLDKRFRASETAKLEWPEMSIEEAARDAEEFAAKKNSEQNGSTDTLPFAAVKKSAGDDW